MREPRPAAIDRSADRVMTVRRPRLSRERKLARYRVGPGNRSKTIGEREGIFCLENV